MVFSSSGNTAGAAAFSAGSFVPGLHATARTAEKTIAFRIDDLWDGSIFFLLRKDPRAGEPVGTSASLPLTLPQNGPPAQPPRWRDPLVIEYRKGPQSGRSPDAPQKNRSVPDRAPFRGARSGRPDPGGQAANRPAVPSPRVDNYIAWLPDAALVYEPSRKSLQIMAMGTLLSHGEGWEVRQVKPYLYHLRRASWKCYFWLINTARREVYVVWDGIFGGIGKKALARGPPRNRWGPRGHGRGRRRRGPGPRSQAIHRPLRRRAALLRPVDGGCPLRRGRVDAFRARRLGGPPVHDGLYHLRLRTWKNFFWKVSTSRMEAWRVRGAAAVFGKPGGEETPLPVTIVKSSIPLSLALLRTALKADERWKLEEIARMIISGKPVGEIKNLSAEFIRQYPDVDPESAVMEVTKEIKRDPDIRQEIKELEKKMEELREKRQEFETAFEDFDQKSNQLINILSTVLKAMKETQSTIARDMM